MPHENTKSGALPIEIVDGQPRLTAAAVLQTAISRDGIKPHGQVGHGNEHPTLAPPPGEEVDDELEG